MSDLSKKIQEFRVKLGYQYPPTLRKLCVDLTGMSPEIDGYDNIINQATPMIFDFAYPIFDESHRQNLEQKIIKRFFFREISCEDVFEWKLRLDAKMNEIMPYYNKMYESVGYLTDILDDVDYTRTFNEQTANTGIENTVSTQNIENNSESSGSSTSIGKTDTDNNQLVASSDTPQGQLTGLLDNTYLSAAAKTDAETHTTNNDSESRIASSSGTSKTDGTFDTSTNRAGQRDNVEKVKGKMYGGSKAKLVMEYRKAILNIDAEIMGRLNDMFMLTYHPYYEEGEDD